LYIRFLGWAISTRIAPKLFYKRRIMRSVNPVRLFIALLLTCVFANDIAAQYFDDLSSNIPDATTNFQTKAVLAVDFDKDGDMDIVLANEFQNNIILINDGQGIFTVGQVGIPATEEHDSEGITIGDFNQDGLIDLVFVSEDDFQHEYYWNSGEGTFNTPPIFLPFTVCRSVLAHDFNGDGIDDLILGNNGQNMMLINDGTGELINETFERIPFYEDLTQDIDISDVDGDGDIDIFVANEDENHLLINNGSNVYFDETATRLPQSTPMDSRSVLFNDVDMDGDEDIFLCNVAFTVGADARNRLFLNNGEGIFTDATDSNLPDYTEQTVDAVFMDFDFDGDDDIIVANVLGIAMGAYVNNGQGKFTDISNVVFGADLIVEAFGITAADFDGDGYEDLYISNIDGKDKLLIRNPLVLSNRSIITQALKLSPNPVQSTVTVQGDWTYVPRDIMIFDTQGRRIMKITDGLTDGNTLHFDLPSTLKNGIYFLEIRMESGIGVARLVVLR
jgi:hypothetical protein